MKKFLMAILLIIAVIVGITSCSTKTEESSKPVIYASFYPIYDLASKIGGDKITVKTIIPPGVEPHDWEPTTKDVASMTKAKTILYLGLGMDSWIDKIKANAPNVAFYEVSKGVTPIVEGSITNPHIWLSPKESLIMTKNINEALQKSFPAYKDYFEKNYQNLKTTLEALDKEYTDALSQTKHKIFIVYHSAFDYLARDYGLKQEALVGMNEEAEVSPARMTEIINLIKNENIKYIFTEPLASPKPIQTIAKETGAQVLPLSTIEGLTKEDIKKKEDYISLMKQNLENLKKALE
ncbi:periplasmic solute binding protein [Thermoanaerobacter mathranii subsp. mathranii str. A3]|uniref:Periplasmic solute binding protein n=1 Tax=Thermoanaerobacter mathranii subsp. mathranii (strain DSM 11426 / CCUG 53645 / CIP 108742 / A3) TaxID=583358 RepID=A0ABN3Z2Q4_THEM3|nr:metal ABC transporter substrate-binding protein [Thermoanaerobacter mathranii]ADH60170.1 periplasmic solute binding protein [Thermoanaerobacter mathranii subsp. mathranii str. A3]